MKKVLEKYHSDSEVVHCLNSMLKDSLMTSRFTISKSIEMAALLDKACNDIDVLRIWALCSIDIDKTDKQLTVLCDIVEEWTKIRGHSIASMELEKHKTKKSDSTKK